MVGAGLYLAVSIGWFFGSAPTDPWMAFAGAGPIEHPTLLIRLLQDSLRYGDAFDTTRELELPCIHAGIWMTGLILSWKIAVGTSRSPLRIAYGWGFFGLLYWVAVGIFNIYLCALRGV